MIDDGVQWCIAWMKWGLGIQTFYRALVLLVT